MRAAARVRTVYASASLTTRDGAPMTHCQWSGARHAPQNTGGLPLHIIQICLTVIINDLFHGTRYIKLSLSRLLPRLHEQMYKYSALYVLFKVPPQRFSMITWSRGTQEGLMKQWNTLEAAVNKDRHISILIPPLNPFFKVDSSGSHKRLLLRQMFFFFLLLRYVAL